MAYCAYLSVDSGCVTRFFPVVPSNPPPPDQPVMCLNLVATGTPSPAPPAVTLTMEASSPPVVIPYQGARSDAALESPTIAGPLRVEVTYGPVGAPPLPGAGESRFQLKFFLATGGLDALQSTAWGIRIDASGGATGQSFCWVVSDSASDDHGVVLPVLVARRAAVVATMKVGTDPAAVEIARFTGDAIDGMSSTTLANTVPTSGGVKTHVAGVVAGAVNAAVTGTAGSYPKFTDVHVLGASAISEASGTVTVKGALSVNNNGTAASSTLNVLGATTLQSTLKVGTDGNAVQIARFTGEAIGSLSDANLGVTVPTSGGVKTHVAGVVAGAVNAAVTGTVGTHPKFTDAHVLGASAVSEAAGTVTVAAALKVGTSGTAAAVTRFTADAIQGLSSDDLAGTVPTAQAVKNFLAFSLPPGTVMAYASETAPAGWRECDGSSLDGANPAFAALFAVVGTAFGNGNGSASGFNLPDLRGRFVRGWSHGSGRDPDAASRSASAAGGQVGDRLGSVQAQQFPSHSHSVSASGWSNAADPIHSHSFWSNTGVTWDFFQGVKVAGGGSSELVSHLYRLAAFWDSTTSTSIWHQHFTSVSGSASASGGAESRPVNIYLTYIIKL